MEQRSHEIVSFLTRWYRVGWVLSLLGPVWLAVFGLYYGLRNYCSESCEHPAVQPADHWPAWLGTAVCVVMIWTALLLIGSWRRRARDRALGDREARRVHALPWVFGLALIAAIYAVVAQSSIRGGTSAWTYTGGTVWLWLLPVLGAVGVAWWAAIRLDASGTRAVLLILVAAVVGGSGYVTWKSDPGEAAAGEATVGTGGTEQLSISQPKQVIDDCSADPPPEVLCGHANAPRVVAGSGGLFTVFYSTFDPVMGLLGRTLSPTDADREPAVLRSTPAVTGGPVSSVGFGSEFDAIPMQGGNFALASLEFGFHAVGNVDEGIAAAPLGLQFLRPGPEAETGTIPVTTGLSPAQQAPSLAIDADRGHTLVAQSSVQGQPMAVQLLDSAGRSLAANRIAAQSAYGGSAGYPTAAAFQASSQRFLVAWAESRRGLLLQAFDVHGSSLSAPLQVAGPEAFPVNEIRLTDNPRAGGTLLVWSTATPSDAASEGSVSARMVADRGQDLGPTTVLDRATGSGASISAAREGTGFLVSWLASHQTSGAEVRATVYRGDRLSAATHTVWKQSSSSDGEISWALNPVTSTGLVVWNHDQREIQGEFVPLDF